MKLTPNIWINAGEFSLREITSVGEAVAFLDEWPLGNRSPFYYVAANSMKSAAHGSISAVDAREAFWLFCREVGILAEERLASD